MDVSEIVPYPKSSILIGCSGCSIINHPFWGTCTPIFGKIHRRQNLDRFSSVLPPFDVDLACVVSKWSNHSLQGGRIPLEQRSKPLYMTFHYTDWFIGILILAYRHRIVFWKFPLKPGKPCFARRIQASCGSIMDRITWGSDAGGAAWIVNAMDLEPKKWTKTQIDQPFHKIPSPPPQKKNITYTYNPSLFELFFPTFLIKPWLQPSTWTCCKFFHPGGDTKSMDRGGSQDCSSRGIWKLPLEQVKESYPSNRLKMSTLRFTTHTWRFIPVSRWLVTPVYKSF